MRGPLGQPPILDYYKRIVDDVNERRNTSIPFLSEAITGTYGRGFSSVGLLRTVSMSLRCRWHQKS